MKNKVSIISITINLLLGFVFYDHAFSQENTNDSLKRAPCFTLDSSTLNLKNSFFIGKIETIDGKIVLHKYKDITIEQLGFLKQNIGVFNELFCFLKEHRYSINDNYNSFDKNSLSDGKEKLKAIFVDSTYFELLIKQKKLMNESKKFLDEYKF